MSGDIVIRASSTPTILDCPRRWAARALPELLADAGYPLRQIAQHIGAPIGTGVHAAGAHMLGIKRDFGEPPPFKEAEERGMVALDEAMAEAGEIMWDATARDRTDAQRQVSRMAIAYADQVVPKIEPLLVEQRLTMRAKPGFLVRGHLDDLVTYQRARRAIRDTKTGATPTGVAPQLGTYSMAAEANGWQVDDLLIDFIKRGSLKKPQEAVRTVPLDLDAAEAAADTAIRTAVGCTESFQATGDIKAFPANPGSKLCSAKFCPAWGTRSCRAHFPESDDEGVML